MRVVATAVDRLAPDLGHLRHIGRAALTPFDLDGAHTHLHQLRQQRERVQTGWLLDRVVVVLSAHVETAFAQGRVASIFAALIAIDQYTIESGLASLRRLDPAHGFGRRADAIRIRGLTRHIA